jgi:hypothetical protein
LRIDVDRDAGPATSGCGAGVRRICDASLTGEPGMRFLMLIKSNADSEAGILPSREMLDALAKYNESMLRAGVLLDVSGLQASSRGARVRFRGDQRHVIDGPFTGTKELIAGYWMIEVKSKAEALEWAKRCPAPAFGEELEIEVRQVFEISDFPADKVPPCLGASTRSTI